MTAYRVYCLDFEGRSVGVQPLSASSDEEAVRQASAMTGLQQCEVWRGDRLITRITEFRAQ